MIKTNHEYQVKSIEELKEAPYNPRDIDFSAMMGLAYSLDEFGLVSPLVWNKQTGHVVGCNQRLRVMKDRGITEVPCIVVDMPIEREKALNVALNNNATMGKFTPEVKSVVDDVLAHSVELYDQLLLNQVEFDSTKEAMEDSGDDKVPQMEIQPFEHYDYAVIMCKTSQDWHWLKEFLCMSNVNASLIEKKKIGLGRVVNCERFRQIVKDRGAHVEL